MDSLVQKELAEANKKYVFKEHNGVKALCHDNVVFVETMILHNPRYSNFYGEKSGTKNEIMKLKSNVNFKSLKTLLVILISKTALMPVKKKLVS